MPYTLSPTKVDDVATFVVREVEDGVGLTLALSSTSLVTLNWGSRRVFNTTLPAGVHAMPTDILLSKYLEARLAVKGPASGDATLTVWTAETGKAPPLRRDEHAMPHVAGTTPVLFESTQTIPVAKASSAGQLVPPCSGVLILALEVACPSATTAYLDVDAYPARQSVALDKEGRGMFWMRSPVRTSQDMRISVDDGADSSGTIRTTLRSLQFYTTCPDDGALGPLFL